MACDTRVFPKYSQPRYCRQHARKRACGHRLCDQHARSHVCNLTESATPRFTEQDAMRAMSRALGCPDPYDR